MKCLELLKNEIAHNTLSHAYLLIGAGEAEISEVIKLIADAKGIRNFDISVLKSDDKKSEIKVEAIRELLHNVNLSSHGSGRLVVICDCERLNQSSGNVLLKTLEEPPGGVIFILAANNETVLNTIRSRCRVMKVNKAVKDTPSDKIGKLLRGGFVTASKEIERIIKQEETQEFLEEIENYLRTLMLKTGNKKYATALLDFEKSKYRIINNGNARLILENIALRLSELVR